MDKLGFNNDVELLEHFPSRYDPLTPTVEKAPDVFKDEEQIRVQISIFSVKTLLRNQIVFFSGYGKMCGFRYDFMLYRQMFYLSRIAIGKKAFVVGVYNAKRKRFTVRSVYEPDNRFVLSGIKPVYRLPKEIGQSSFERAVEKALDSESMLYIKDRVPSEFVKKYKLLNRYNSFKCVHLPKNEEDLKLGLRTFRYEECLSFCLKMIANRRYLSLLKKGTFTKIDRARLNDLAKLLPFKLTEDQVNAIKEIVEDMNSGKVMFRLLEGDVSTGKTMVAFFALYANHLRGGQGVLLAPTMALAQQHYENAKKILEPAGLKVGLLISKMKTKEKRELLSGLAAGSIDVLITTQAGVGETVSYSRLTLAIIDEQQNFGVSQRAAIISKGTVVDTLMMSATPIPRTIAKITAGDTSLSVLKQFPTGVKRKVDTRVCRSDDAILKKAIEKALAKTKRVFVVVPRIEEMAESTEETGINVSAKQVYEQYAKDFGADKVQLLHGRLKAESQEKILADFRSGNKPILVTTSVIEVGMDIKEASLMIIYSANMFGLSSLHQLRGRIGRDGNYSLALLVYDGSDDKAKAKLEYLASTDDGFEISLYDAKTRGTGTISGFNQSGDSLLEVADFVGNQAMFECATHDAEEILDNINSNSEFREYAEKNIGEKTIKDVLLG